MSYKSMEPVIQVKNLSKRYNIIHQKGKYAALRDILSFVIKHPIKTLKHRVNKILGRTTTEVFFALKDINFTVNKGEVVGIIGRNGAGKSTLLKILTKITPPTEGEVRIKGRVASLLEVGTGFHPELSGRENIYLNGAIMGMTRKEIADKFDRIVEFAGVEQFIDTPVKRYSSGMYVRLAFSVAAHLEPDVLLIDEVLAVGDAEFQRKCFGKIEEVTSGGRTILFVSHDMDAIRRLCKKTVFINRGTVVAIGDTEKMVDMYLRFSQDEMANETFRLPAVDRDVTLKDFLFYQQGNKTNNIDGGETFEVRIDFSITRKLHPFRIGIFIKNSFGDLISRSFVQDWAPKLEIMEPGEYAVKLVIPRRMLLSGQYNVEVKAFCPGTVNYFEGKIIQKVITVHEPKEYNRLRSKSGTIGHFLIPTEWDIKVVDTK